MANCDKSSALSIDSCYLTDIKKMFLLWPNKFIIWN